MLLNGSNCIEVYAPEQQICLKNCTKYGQKYGWEPKICSFTQNIQNRWHLKTISKEKATSRRPHNVKIKISGRQISCGKNTCLAKGNNFHQPFPFFDTYS